MVAGHYRILSFAALNSTGYELHSTHRDAEWLQANLIDWMKPLGIRNIQIYVYNQSDSSDLS